MDREAENVCHEMVWYGGARWREPAYGQQSGVPHDVVGAKPYLSFAFEMVGMPEGPRSTQSALMWTARRTACRAGVWGVATTERRPLHTTSQMPRAACRAPRHRGTEVQHRPRQTPGG